MGGPYCEGDATDASAHCLATLRRGEARAGAGVADATPMVLAGEVPRAVTSATGGGLSPRPRGALPPSTAGDDRPWRALERAARARPLIVVSRDALGCNLVAKSGTFLVEAQCGVGAEGVVNSGDQMR